MTDKKIYSFEEARDEIESHISPDDGHSVLVKVYENWYCGITDDPEDREGQHKNDGKDFVRHFVALETGSKEVARQVEVHFHNLGMKPGPESPEGGANENSRFVYVYKRTIP